MNYNFSHWTAYFNYNKNNLMEINWDEKSRLTPHEKEDLQESIRQFQKGESSEGKYLFKKAKSYIADEHNQSYFDALKALIFEEHRHSKDLAKFLELEEIPKLRKHWLDDIFRAMRRPVPLEYSILVLLVAEIIAAVYYVALRDASKSKLLKQLCWQIIWDEEKHITFQSESLQVMFNRRGSIIKWINIAMFSTLMVGASVVVWFSHKKVFKRAGMGFFSYTKSIFVEFFRSFMIVQSRMPKKQVSVAVN